VAGEVEKSDEDLRQEGREEVLEWLRQRELLNYSTREKQYFIWNKTTEVLMILPFKNGKN